MTKAEGLRRAYPSQEPGGVDDSWRKAGMCLRKHPGKEDNRPYGDLGRPVMEIVRRQPKEQHTNALTFLRFYRTSHAEPVGAALEQWCDFSEVC